MEMHAYPSDYLSIAQRIMGDMLDFAVNSCEFEIDTFYTLFLGSDISIQFQNGNPTYIAGKTGCEIVKEIIEESGMQPVTVEDAMYLDKSLEYWVGWAIAYYQWYTCRSFMMINHAIPVGRIVDMYDAYHEMDIMHFVERMNEIWDAYYAETNLARIRKLAGLSQNELANLADVSVRQIQLFEQRKRDINHTRAIDAVKLGRVLGCSVEDILQI